MNDKLDEALKEYYADRISPAPAVKAQLRERLQAASARQAVRWSWIILLYAAFFSAMITLVLWMLTGSGLLTFACVTYLLLSSAGGAAITITCQKARVSYGDALSPMYSELN